jgi:hypothetical protein
MHPKLYASETQGNSAIYEAVPKPQFWGMLPENNNLAL